MTAATIDEFPDPGKFPSAVLAVLVHLALFALLYFGVQWHSAEPEAVVVELWNAPPPVSQPISQPVSQPIPQPILQPEPPPPTQTAVAPESVPEPPAPLPKVVKAKPEPAPIPKVEPKPVPKPDIALKQKQEKLKKQQEQKQHEEQQREQIKQQQAADRAQAQKDRAQQLRKEQQLLLAQRQAADEQNQRNAQHAAAKNRAADEYFGKIKAKIRSNIVNPEGLVGNPEAVFDVVQLPSGEILSAKLKKSSGNPAYDTAVERAILKSSPLPKPGQPDLFARDMVLRWKPLDDK